MCVIFFTTNTLNYKLIIAGNRDEFLDRPTLKAHFWNDFPCILGGIDCGIESFGTWMGISKNGRFSFLTNKRQDPKLIKSNMISRGLLVRDFLQFDTDPIDYCNSIIPQNYNGYFLVVGNVNDGMYLTTNDENDALKLYNLNSNTVYGLSNGPFTLENSTWPKVEKGKHLFKQALNSFKDRDELVSKLFSILRDTSIPDKEELPAPIFNAQVEEFLSPICVDCQIDQKPYGTRTHTVILVDEENNVYFEEIDRLEQVQGTNLEIGNFSSIFEFQLK